MVVVSFVNGEAVVGLVDVVVVGWFVGVVVDFVAKVKVVGLVGGAEVVGGLVDGVVGG